MPKIDNKKFYLNAYKKYGQTPKGLNWHEQDSQQKRFEIIYRFLKPILKENDTLVDAGCGFGDFYNFLESKRLKCEYIGYDILQEFVDIAKKNTKQKIYQKDILTDSLTNADFYVASGSLNILSKFETFLFIQRCFSCSKKAFIFNMLEGDYFHKDFNICKENEIISIAKKLNAKVLIKRDYLKGDVTFCFSL